MSLEDTSSNMFFTQLHLVHQFVKKITDQTEITQCSDKLRNIGKDKKNKYIKEAKQGEIISATQIPKYYQKSIKLGKSKVKIF